MRINKEQLRINKEQLRINKEQLRINKEQLRINKEQLRINKEQLRIKIKKIFKNLINFKKMLQEEPFSADQILDQWRADRRLLSKNITSKGLIDPTSKIISKCTECKCEVIKPSPARGVCYGCRLTSRLYTNGLITLNTPAGIQAGKYQPMALISRLYLDSHNSGYELLPDKSQKIFKSKGSKVEHYAIICSFLEHEMLKDNILCVPTFKWLWDCCNNYVVVEECSTFGVGISKALYYEFKHEKHPLRSIIGQLLIALKYLSRFMFSFGSPTIDRLSFGLQATSYQYEGIKINSNIILRIIPSSSSTLGILDEEDIIRIISSDEAQPKLEDIVDLTENFYIIKSPLFRNYIDTGGNPYFNSSYNLYSLLVELISNEYFNLYLKQDIKLMDVLSSIFNVKDFNVLIEGGDISTFNWLQDKELKVDALDIVFEKFSKI
jgi:hypothetical protein